MDVGLLVTMASLVVLSTVQVSRARVPWGRGHVQVCVERSSVLRDSVQQIASLQMEDLRKTFRFKFRGEPGVDAGGLARCGRQLRRPSSRKCASLTPRVCVGVMRGGAQRVVHGGNRGSVQHGLWLVQLLARGQFELPDQPKLRAAALGPQGALLLWCVTPVRLACARVTRALGGAVGRFLGKALLDGQLAPAHMARPLFKHLLGVPMSFEDMEFVDRNLYLNLRWMVENEGVEALMVDFTVTESVLGEVRTEALKVRGIGTSAVG